MREVRTVIANILKYVRGGASPNFDNMFSVIGASALLPFVPMALIQILATNLVQDLRRLPVPTDRVDDEQFAKPRPWSMTGLRRYIPALGFVPLPASYWPLLAGTGIHYLLETQLVKM